MIMVLIFLVLPPQWTHHVQAFDLGLPSPLKTRLAQLCDQADLTLPEQNMFELSESFSSLRWLGDQRRLLFRAFLWAKDETASMRNITSAFSKVALNPATRPNKLDERFPDPPDFNEMTSCRMPS
jgi:hypothetical protein